MFEAVIAVCLDLSAGPCRDVLLPGYEAPDKAGCEAALSVRAPSLPKGLTVRGGPYCGPVGEALAVEEVAPGVFVHAGLIEEPDERNRGDVSNLGFVIGETGVAVIDSGSARWMGEALWRSIRARTGLPVTHVILTHMHPDHVFGASLFAGAGADIVGHEGLARALADRNQTYLDNLGRLVGLPAFLGTVPPTVTISVDATAEFDLGDRMLELRAWPPAHTGTDLTVLDRASGVLFAGDLVFDRHAPALDGSIKGWRAVLGMMSAMDLTGVVPGHGAALLVWPEGGAALERYLSVLEADTRAAIDAGARLGAAMDTIAAGEAENWALFDAYNARNATVAFTELEWE